jgi:hypothetical protein
MHYGERSSGGALSRVGCRGAVSCSVSDGSSASALLTADFANGLEFDVMTHTDPDLLPLRRDSIYPAFALVR